MKTVSIKEIVIRDSKEREYVSDHDPERRAGHYPARKYPAGKWRYAGCEQNGNLIYRRRTVRT